MKTVLLSVAFIFSISTAFGQHFQFVNFFIGNGYAQPFSIGVDSQRNIYSTGHFQSTFDFDPDYFVTQNLNCYFKDIYISKLDSLGNYVWAKNFGNNLSGDEPTKIVVDNSGFFLLSGYVTGDADLDPGSGTYMSGGDTGFVSKFDSDGNLIWVKTLDVSYFKINTDVNNNIYLFGGFSNTVDFDPGAGVFNLTSPGSQDIFIVKLDPSGDFVWAKNYNSAFWSGIRNINVDGNGNLYVAGSFEGQFDADPGTGVINLYSQGSQDLFVAKLNSSGDALWAKSIGSFGAESCDASGIDSLGNIYLGGVFYNTVDFDPGGGAYNMTAAGSSPDLYYLKLDASGNFIWAKTISSIGGENVIDMKVDKGGNFYCTGAFNANVVDFDPDPAGYSFLSIVSGENFTQKLDSSGALLWVKQFGSSQGTIGVTSGIAVDELDNVYLSGGSVTSALVKWDPGASNYTTTTSPSFSIFVMKYSSIPVPAPLPLKLLSFDANAVDKGIQLKWVTASEINTDKFEIQRSKNGIDWEFVGVKKALGNSNIKNTYSYLDVTPFTGESYYRIKETDLDGSELCSKIEKVNWSIALNKLKPYPNPTERFVSFQLKELTGNADIHFYNSLGVDIISNISMNKVSDKVTFDLSRLAAGTYILLTGDQQSVILKK